MVWPNAGDFSEAFPRVISNKPAALCGKEEVENDAVFLVISAKTLQYRFISMGRFKGKACNAF